MLPVKQMSSVIQHFPIRELLRESQIWNLTRTCLTKITLSLWYVQQVKPETLFNKCVCVCDECETLMDSAHPLTDPYSFPRRFMATKSPLWTPSRVTTPLSTGEICRRPSGKQMKHTQKHSAVMETHVLFTHKQWHRYCDKQSKHHQKENDEDHWKL